MPLKTCNHCGAAFEPTASSRTYCPEHAPKGRVSRSPTTRAQDAEYRAERTRLLAGSPRCELRIVCNGALATTVDHVVPVAEGGGHKGNLVPACSACNNRKGARVATRPLGVVRPAPRASRLAPRLA